ncbi:DUF1573 domain-containing protein [Marinifilum caeruleilacunae]|uniref:DUF1573 domain-containing protein n=1 Tax=Marinifilum caeruleilacunae TaxID=2499076 RepID=A0ABX1X0Y7_9BACT|nr:DUF1573 domain-containing protein [Marinifilum caeruleilacunae]NOU62032.1 DUF1573 domain-containing protein [Marinifilum caeruleilacunae]
MFMKKNHIGLLIVMGFSIVIWLCLKDDSVDQVFAPPTEVDFTKTEVDMGNIQKGKIKEVCFQLKNTGNFPLLIRYVETSCSCINSKWTNHPVMPGKFSEIKISYEAKNIGRFFKTITVFCNTNTGFVELRIKGSVKTLR